MYVISISDQGFNATLIGIHTYMQEIITSIIADAVHAPSGENAQPWKFAVQGNTLFLFNKKDDENIFFNGNEIASNFSHGAVLEIITISASHYGYRTNITLFPKNVEVDFTFKDGDTSPIASITFIEETISEDTLYPYITERCTNRNSYKNMVLTPHETQELLDACENEDLGDCTIINNRNRLRELAKVVSNNERLIFENKTLHDFLYRHIIWNKKDENKSSGFYIKTLESSIMKILTMKMLKSWTLVSFLNTFFNFGKVIALISQIKYTNSGSFGLISVNGNSPSDYIKAGRTAERVWLTATKLGLSMQPSTGILYLQKNLKQSSSHFSPKNILMIEETCKSIATIFDDHDNLCMLFRIGHAKRPKDVATRIAPEIVFI